jgi:16S rRNA (guanine966-N2)-methyltransferase
MSLKILGGIARGFSLDVPPENLTRPTSVLLKRRFFDSYQNLEGIYFIDLCAGSGSVALEASSRGALPVLCVEKSEKVSRVLKKNINNFIEQFPGRNIDINKEDFGTWFKKFSAFYKQLDSEQKQRVFIFFDPPYENIELYETFFSKINECHFEGLAIVETCRQKTIPEDEFYTSFGKPTRSFRQGTSFLHLYDYNRD